MNTIEWAGLSDRGVVRNNNEDAFSISVIADNATSERQAEHGSHRGDGAGGVLLVVSDGVGGQQAGEVASAMAIAEIPEELARAGTSAAAMPSRECGDMLEKALRSANGRIRQAAATETEHKGMAATASVMWFLGRRAILGQVGDSRTYRWRDGRLEQVSHDQSQVGQMQRLGQLSEEEAKFTALRSVVDQALGIRDEELSPEIDWLEVLPGDLFLLSSDGLTDRLKNEQLAAIVRTTEAAGKPLDAIAAELVAAANQAGGRDNVTVLLARVTGEGATKGVATTSAVAQSPAPRGAAASLATAVAITGVLAFAAGAAAMYFGSGQSGGNRKPISVAVPVPAAAPASQGAGAPSDSATIPVATTMVKEIRQGLQSWRTNPAAERDTGEDLRVPKAEVTRTIDSLERLERLLQGRDTDPNGPAPATSPSDATPGASTNTPAPSPPAP